MPYEQGMLQVNIVPIVFFTLDLFLPYPNINGNKKVVIQKLRPPLVFLDFSLFLRYCAVQRVTGIQ